MRVVLVLPYCGVKRSFPASLTGSEHTWLGAIAVYLRQRVHEVNILNFRIGENTMLQNMVKRILKHNSLVMGLSIAGMTINLALSITKEIKKKRPEIHVCCLTSSC